MLTSSLCAKSRDKPKARKHLMRASSLVVSACEGTEVIHPVSQTWTNEVSMEVSLRQGTATAP